MLTERVAKVQPQQLHGGAKLQWCKCGLPGLLERVIRRQRPTLRQQLLCWAVHVGDRAQRRVSSTASGLRTGWRLPAIPDTHTPRDTARGHRFATGSPSNTCTLQPQPRPPPLRSQRAVVPPPPRRLIDRESLATCRCETHAFPPQAIAVRIAAHCTTRRTPGGPSMWHNGHHRSRPWLPGRPARRACEAAPLRPADVAER